MENQGWADNRKVKKATRTSAICFFFFFFLFFKNQKRMEKKQLLSSKEPDCNIIVVLSLGNTD